MQNSLLICHDLIEVIVTALDACDPYTVRHSERVSEIAECICKVMGLSKVESETIHIAAHLHDLGKIKIPNSILGKSADLTEDEWDLMKKHPEIGYQILKNVTGFNKVAQIVRHHHERWDGKGYPSEIAAKNIPLGSRIIAVADSIDAMLSDRKYRRALTIAECKNEIEKNSGLMYDPEITEVVLKNWHFIIENYLKSK